MTMDDIIDQGVTGVIVQVTNPESPFGGVQVFGAADAPIQIEFDSGSPVRSVFGRIGDILPVCSDYASCYAPLGVGLPGGGLLGQVLSKLSNASLDAGWVNLPPPPHGLPAGGSTGQALLKLSNTDYDANWQTLPPGVLPANPTALVGLAAVNGSAATFLRSDGAPALDQSIAPTWSGLHTFDLVPTIIPAPVNSTDAVNKAYADSLFSPTGTRLLTGGGVGYTGTGLNFIISAATYLINGVQYASPQTPVTLAAADPTNDRIDVFFVDNTGTAGVITGIPGGPPLEPQVDPSTQLRLTSAVVPAGSSTPVITTENIYLENTEWTGSTNSPGTINLASTNNPYQGTHCIEGTNAASGNLFTYVRPGGTESLAGYTSLVFQIRSKAAWSNPKSFSIFFLNVNTNVGLSVALRDGGPYGFSSANTTTYQQIVIPLSAFGTGASLVDRIRFTIAGGGGNIGWYIDNIQLQAGGGGGVGGGTVTNFSAGNLSPLFTTLVATPSTTPALSFALSNAGAHQYFGNNTGSTGAPGFHQIAYSELTGTPTPAALTSVNDTNVTVVLGGTPATALLQATSLTMGWSGLLALNRGGLGVDGTSVAAHNYFGNNGGALGSAGFHQIAYSELSGTPSLPSTFARGILWARGNTAGVPTGKIPGYFTVDYPGTITGWSISILNTDSGTVTVRFWKLANGTAVPTVANNINTSGVQLSSGTHIRSSTVTDFTTTTVAAGDIIAVEILSLTGTITDLSGTLEITPT